MRRYSRNMLISSLLSQAVEVTFSEQMPDDDDVVGDDDNVGDEDEDDMIICIIDMTHRF